MSKTTSLIIGLIAFAGHAMAQQPLYNRLRLLLKTE